MCRIAIVSIIWLGLAAHATAFAGQFDRPSHGQRGSQAGTLNRDYYVHRRYYPQDAVTKDHVTGGKPASEPGQVHGSAGPSGCGPSKLDCIAPGLSVASLQ